MDELVYKAKIDEGQELTRDELVGLLNLYTVDKIFGYEDHNCIDVTSIVLLGGEYYKVDWEHRFDGYRHKYNKQPVKAVKKTRTYIPEPVTEEYWEAVSN